MASLSPLSSPTPLPLTWRKGARLTGGRQTIHSTDGSQTRIVEPGRLADYGLMEAA